jgi:two-component system, response regulator YesN
MFLMSNTLTTGGFLVYKLILVDDEEEVRKGVLEKIKWTSLGYEIVGEAENGKDAFEIAERVCPDVVITDIKMPFMDGITLCEKLKYKFPMTKVIILTGFDEFDYAKKAIQLNVIEYVLKPISAEELTGVLKIVKSRLDDEIANKENLQNLKEYYRKSLPILREKFLSSLISNTINKDEIHEKSKTYRLNLEGNRFLASIISIDFYNIFGQRNSDEYPDLTENEMFSKAYDKDLMKFAVLNIAEEIIKKHHLEIIFLHNDQIVILSVSKQENSEELLERTLIILEEIRYNIEKYLKFTVTIGVGSICNEPMNLSYSYENAFKALDYRLILGNNRIIYIEDLEPESDRWIEFDELKEHSLVSSIKVGNITEMKETLENLFEEIVDAKATFNDYQIYFLGIMTTILKVAKDMKVNMDSVFGLNFNLLVEMYKLNDIREVKEWIKGICIKIMSHICIERQDSCKLLVRKAKEYVESKYYENDLTIEKVCKYLHISPNYFSTIFKKETKLTFVSYLTQVRMNTAKDLLRQTNLKFFEIAEKIGYSEPNYFSYCFKKNLGISPSEYRNKA